MRTNCATPHPPPSPPPSRYPPHLSFPPDKRLGFHSFFLSFPPSIKKTTTTWKRVSPSSARWLQMKGVTGRGPLASRAVHQPWRVMPNSNVMLLLWGGLISISKPTRERRATVGRGEEKKRRRSKDGERKRAFKSCNYPLEIIREHAISFTIACVRLAGAKRQGNKG